jgi:lysophospholipase L1-like esterase
MFAIKKKNRFHLIFVSILLLLTTWVGLNIFVIKNLYFISGILFFIWLYLISVYVLFLVFNRKKKIFQNFLVLFTTIFFLIIIVEISLRFTSLRTSSERVWGYFVSPYTASNNINNEHVFGKHEIKEINSSEFHFTRHTNSLGLSDIEPPNKHPNDYLIIGLGDSFTEGVGADTDSTWLKFLERSLNGKTPKHLLYMNAGVGGSDPVFEYRLLEKKLLPYHPNLVIITFAYDLEDIICRGGLERFQPDGSIKYQYEKWWIELYGLSYIFRLFANNILHVNHLYLTPHEYENARTEAFIKLKEVIDKYITLSKKEKFEILFVFCPLKGEVLNKEFDDWNELLKYTSEKKVANLNMLNYFINEVSMNKNNLHQYYWTIDEHLKAKGYEAFAKGIEMKIKEMGILDSLCKKDH